MQAAIRAYEPSDAEAVVALSLRAWEPVFGAVEELLGAELFARLRGDWRAGHAVQVREVLGDPAQHVWVAALDDEPAGFVAATLHQDGGVGEISMIAVDPRAQDRGVGSALTAVATDWLKESGMRVAMIETGGDPGHAAARRVYEKSGYTPLPAVRFFKLL